MMTHPIRLLLFVWLAGSSLAVFAQTYCLDDRFDKTIFDISDVQISYSIPYGTAVSWTGATGELLMDVYQPDPDLDVLEKKPLLIYVHGGGLNGGSKNNGLPVYLCTRFAQNGYVTAAIDYRLGWADYGNCSGDTTSLQLARYRADQDTRAAIRYLKENADLYHIDTNYIFLTGVSVGMTTSLYSAYGEQADYYSYIVDELGALDSSGNSFYNHSLDIKGIFGSGAGIPQPQILDRAEIPILFFHGTCDFTVPYQEAPLFYCSSPVTYPTYYGARYLSSYMKEMGHPYQLYTNEKGNHGAVDSATLFEYAIPFLKDILCNSLVSKEIYEYHNNGCLVTNIDTIIMEIRPNPVEDEINLVMRAGASGMAAFHIYDLTGKLVNIQEIEYYAPIGSFRIPINSNLPTGLYFLEVRVGETSKGVLPFVKE